MEFAKIDLNSCSK